MREITGLYDSLTPIGWSLVVWAAVALAVWLACRSPFVRRRPAVCHGLWLLVLVGLVVSPTVMIPKGTGISGSPSATVCPCGAIGCDCQRVSAAVVATPNMFAGVPQSRSALLLGLALGISLTGTCGLCFVVSRQYLRMNRLLKGTAIETGQPAKVLREVSRKFTLRSPIILRIVDAPVAPMLWRVPGHAAIVLPRHLAESLDTEGLRHIFAHELAHYERGDHWTHMLGLAAAMLWWWNPLVWFARSQLCASAEACCDALALERLRGSRKSYALTLLKVVDFVAEARPQRPSLGITFGASHSLRRRVEMIADARVKGSSRRSGWGVIAAGMMVLLIVPAVAQEEPAPQNPAAQQPRPTPVTASPNAKEEPIEWADRVYEMDLEFGCCPTNK